MTPTRAEFERLKQAHADLTKEIARIRETVRQQSDELRTQFVRMAQIQAVLDEERIAGLKR